MSSDPVAELSAAVRAGDAAHAKLALHPYLQWTEGSVVVRGRVRVLAHLTGRTTLAEPESVELRDGQIYRWSGPAAP